MKRPLLCLVLLLPAVAAAQDVRLLPCAQINFTGPGCVAPALPPAIEVPTPPASEPPLFTTETVSPTMSPLLLQLFQDPWSEQSAEKADAFVTWHLQRLMTLPQVQQHLREAIARNPLTQVWREQYGQDVEAIKALLQGGQP